MMCSSQPMQEFLQVTLPCAWDSSGLKDLFHNDQAIYVLFQQVMREYADGVSQEVEFQRRLLLSESRRTSDVQQLLQDYEMHRKTSAGVAPTLVFGHFFVDNEPAAERAYQDPDFRELLRVASLIAGIDNDLMSF